MDYFYSPPDKFSQGQILIDGEEYVHLVHVMRKKSGDVIRVADGEGTVCEGVLENLKNREAVVRVTSTYPNHNEPKVSLTVAAAILKNPSRFDFLIEKCSELGVKEFVPLRTEHSIPSQAKVDRWQKLALAAMKQCGRGFLPRVGELMTLEQLLVPRKKFVGMYVAHEQTDEPLPNMPAGSTASVLVLVGPEGGFSDREIEVCVEAGIKPVSLGVRRLRAETAAIAAAVRILA